MKLVTLAGAFLCALSLTVVAQTNSDAPAANPPSATTPAGQKDMKANKKAKKEKKVAKKVEKKADKKMKKDKKPAAAAATTEKK